MSENEKIDLIPKQGERTLIVGGTGQGKTSLTAWLLKRVIQAPTIIYDVKIEPKFEALAHSVVVTDIPELVERLNAGEHDYIIVRPHESLLTNPEALDKLLMFHYQKLHGKVAYIDELGLFHRGYIAGPGLMSLLARGRSKGITLIMSTQRPTGISRSCITEAQAIIALRLQDKRDRQRLDDLYEDFSRLPVPKKHFFYYWNADLEKPVLFAPVKLDPELDTGYIDNAATHANSMPDGEEDAPGPSIWI